MNIDVLAICSHPDDAELCCGGYLIKANRCGMKTAVLDLSSGDMGTRGTAQIRATEAKEGAKKLGLQQRLCLSIPDGHILHNEDNISKVATVIRQLKPKIILTPYWEDHHPDHANTSKIVKDAWWFAGVKKYPIEGETHRAERILYYISRYRIEPNFIFDISDVFAEKTSAVLCYGSQLYSKSSSEPITQISNPSFLEGWEAKQRALGSSIGVQYGEGYIMRTPVPLNDPRAVLLDVAGII